MMTRCRRRREEKGEGGGKFREEGVALLFFIALRR